MCKKSFPILNSHQEQNEKVLVKLKLNQYRTKQNSLSSRLLHPEQKKMYLQRYQFRWHVWVNEFIKRHYFYFYSPPFIPWKFFFLFYFFFDMGHDVSDIKIFQIGVVIHDIQFTNFYSRIQFCWFKHKLCALFTRIQYFIHLKTKGRNLRPEFRLKRKSLNLWEI